MKIDKASVEITYGEKYKINFKLTKFSVNDNSNDDNNNINNYNHISY